MHHPGTAEIGAEPWGIRGCSAAGARLATRAPARHASLRG